MSLDTMGFHPSKARLPGQFPVVTLSASKGALQIGEQYCAPFDSQTQLIRMSWSDSGKVYGYRKLHDDLMDMGESCSPNRVARLTRLAGIRAQIGYKRRPGQYGGKPCLAVDNTLHRRFDVEAPDKAW